MKMKEERANDKIPEIVEIYLVVEISQSSQKNAKERKNVAKKHEAHN